MWTTKKKNVSSSIFRENNLRRVTNLQLSLEETGVVTCPTLCGFLTV